MNYSGPERRKFPRIDGRFIVSYRILEEADNIDITQTKNVSIGGLLLTTNRQFEPGINLALEIRLPFDPNPIMLVGVVIESLEITKNLIYDTRLSVIKVDDKHKNIINKTIDYFGSDENLVAKNLFYTDEFADKKGYNKAITYFHGNEEVIKEEVFYTDKFSDEKGVNRSITYLDSNGRMTRAEYFHTDKFANEQGYDRSIVYFESNGNVTKNEYYRDGKQIETR